MLDAECGVRRKEGKKEARKQRKEGRTKDITYMKTLVSNMNIRKHEQAMTVKFTTNRIFA